MKKTSFCENWIFKKSGDENGTIVTLPHDAMQTADRTPDAPSGSGCAYYLGESYIYEKTFFAPEEWANQTVLVEFEGVYPTAKVYLNGTRIGGFAYGYNLFRVELTGCCYGKENTLMVEADNSALPNSRWYSGAGIYRPVWLLTGEKAHILPDGIRVTTVSYDPAQIQVEIAVSPEAELAADIKLYTEILYRGEKVAEGIGNSLTLSIPDAHLWDAENPNLYECKVTLYKTTGCKNAEAESSSVADAAACDTKATDNSTEYEICDTASVTFGIRKLEWSTQGFFVNGKSVLLKGGCIHHDNGILGARSYDKSEWRRIAKLKEIGFNAIRSSHNPACRAMLEACDALGMYVMDELWDMWDKSKTDHDYASRFMEHYAEDIVSIAAKDYNHPSVVMYSIGNEVTEPAKPEGVEIAKDLCAKVKAADPTRPVTAGINLTLLLLASMGNNPLAGGGDNAANSTESAASGSDKATDSKDNTAGSSDSIAAGSSESAASDSSNETDSSENNAGGTDAAEKSKKMSSTEYNEMVSNSGNSMTRAAAMPQADAISSPVLDLLDIAGYNYAVSRYENEGEIHPDRIVVGSETYTYELARTWPMVEKYPYLIGDFMWTAWDYLGEAGIGGWSYDEEDVGFGKAYPWLLADSGAIDILGNDNAGGGLASVVWGVRETPYIGACPVNHPGITPIKAIWRASNALPYWSYQGCDGNETDVEVYTMGAEAELFINGRSVGRSKVTDALAVFHVQYEPGELKAVAYDEQGQVLSESSLYSADEHTQIQILPEEEGVSKGEILYLDISLTGENGEIECNRDTKLTVDVDGGKLLAFGSANPKTEERFETGSYTTYYGRAQAVILVEENCVMVKVTGEGLPEANAVVVAE